MLHFYLLVMQVFGDIIDYKDLNVSIVNGQAFDFNLQKSGFCGQFLCLHTCMEITVFEESRSSFEVALIIR